MLVFKNLKQIEYLILLPLFLLGASINFAHCEEKNNVTWITESFTPFYISLGKDNGQGTVDKLLNLLEDEMNDFEHKRRPLPILRLIEALKAKDNIACASFLYDPKISNFAQFSIPLFAVPPQELIIRRSTWLKLGSPKSVSLEKALSSEQFTLGLGKGRNYGIKLTTIIDKFKQDNPKIYFRVGDHFNGLADMIVHDRIDATIAYSGEANFYLSNSGNADTLVRIPIEENDKALLVYIVMPKSEWGDAFLKQVNEAIYHVRLRPEYIDATAALFDHTDAFDHALENLIEHSKMHFKTE